MPVFCRHRFFYFACNLLDKKINIINFVNKWISVYDIGNGQKRTKYRQEKEKL